MPTFVRSHEGRDGPVCDRNGGSGQSLTGLKAVQFGVSVAVANPGKNDMACTIETATCITPRSVVDILNSGDVSDRLDA
jgi:hypothetical protein